MLAQRPNNTALEFGGTLQIWYLVVLKQTFHNPYSLSFVSHDEIFLRLKIVEQVPRAPKSRSNASIMKIPARNESQNAAGSETRPVTDLNLWQHIRRRFDHGAVENNYIRRACHRVKTAIKGKSPRLKASRNTESNKYIGKSMQASVERHESPKRTGLLQPLKKAWRKATEKSPGDKATKDEDNNVSRVSNITAPDEHDSGVFSDTSTISMVSEHARILEAAYARAQSRSTPPSSEVERHATEIPRSGSNEPHHPGTTESSVPFDQGRSSEALERSPLFIPWDSISQLQISCHNPSLQSSDFGEHESAAYNQTSSETTRQYAQMRHSTKTLPTRLRTNSRCRPSTQTHATRTRTPSLSDGLITVGTASYERIANAARKAQYSRIPIPVAWQNITPRAYNFRGPSSPYQNVTTVPLRAEKMRMDSKCATEPQLSTPPWSSMSPDPNSSPILRDIAARSVPYFSSPECRTNEESRSQVPPKRRVDSSTIDRRPQRSSPTHLQRQKTLPRDWRVKNSLSRSMSPMPTSSRVLSGANRSRFLPPVTLNDDGEGEDVWCREASICAGESSMQACDSATDTDENQSDAHDDVWIEEASRSDVAVVNAPLH
jgi:hypothetical protein